MLLLNDVQHIAYNDMFIPNAWTTQPMEMHTYVDVLRYFKPSAHYDSSIVSIDACLDHKHTFTCAYKDFFPRVAPPPQSTNCTMWSSQEKAG